MPANRIDEIYKKGSGSNYSKFNKTKENVSLPKSNKTFSQIYNIILKRQIVRFIFVAYNINIGTCSNARCGIICSRCAFSISRRATAK